MIAFQIAEMLWTMATTTSANGEIALASISSGVSVSTSGGRPGPSPCVHVT